MRPQRKINSLESAPKSTAVSLCIYCTRSFVLLRCAEQGNFNVIIVSRDSDYGVTIAKETYINDWLLREFRNRVSKKRQITLTPRLSEALEVLKVQISAEEEKVEEELVEASEENRIAAAAPSTIRDKYFDEWLKTMQQKMRDVDAQRVVSR